MLLGYDLASFHELTRVAVGRGLSHVYCPYMNSLISEISKGVLYLGLLQGIV